MEDRQGDEAVKPRERREVSERELNRVLDESLWQVERLRVEPKPEGAERPRVIERKVS